MVLHVTKRPLKPRQIAGRRRALDLVEQGRRLDGTASLPILVAIPGGKRAQHSDEQPSDEIAVGFPEVPEFVKLLLFFKVEMFCHVTAELSVGL